MSTEDKVTEIFRKYHLGKGIKTQEDYNSNPVVRLSQVYTNWVDYHFGSRLDERIKGVQATLSQIPFSISDMEKFHMTFPILQNKEQVEKFPHEYQKESIHYLGFIVALAEHLKERQGYSAIRGTELHPFFESKLLLPQIIYMESHSAKAKLKFKNMDTVILYECEWGSLSDFDAGNLIIDCEAKGITSVGNKMRSGKIVVTNKTKLSGRLQDLGYKMEGGQITYNGDLSDAYIGEEMLWGTIIINGTVRGDSHIGNNMKNGEIILKGNYEGKQYNNLCGIGYGMQNGKIIIEGAFTGNGHLGWYMSGGTIEVLKGINGEEICVGDCMSGNSYIKIHSHCKGYRVGNLMTAGKIEISGDAGVSIGSSMKGGAIEIGGNVYQIRGQTHYSLGSDMEGGEIRVVGNVPLAGCGMKRGMIFINGNVEEAGQEMEGGVIRIGGYLENKKYIVKLGGEIYEKGVLVKPKLGFRLLGGVMKSMSRFNKD